METTNSTPRSFAGLTLDRPLVMGVVNVTPDSFSDGGEFAEPAAAIVHGLALLDQGADIIDVGGESTRPGAAATTIEEERRRVLPVVEALAGRGAKVSIDTRQSTVMRDAIAAGASIVNDVTALAGDPDSLDVVARSNVAAILMHMHGEPATMQAAPAYDDVVGEVEAFLAARLAIAEAAGIPRAHLAIDPGIGFGKTLDHNLLLLRATRRLKRLGVAVVVGVSRKSFIARLSKGEPPKQRLAGSLAAALAALARGADVLRVHDVAASVQAIAVWRAIEQGDAL
ncbi:MAG TPA: dihydropteroate synthase [Alphaproteobacteria bacterium]|nr:dihydropteroate synthase [Alphaproteobacteria bacterium]